MDRKLLNMLEELKSEDILISDDVNEEARNNTRYLIFSREELLSLGKDKIGDFLRSCIQLEKGKWDERPFIIYCWFDDMAGHTRICSISQKHGKPLFSSSVKLKQLKSLDEVVGIAFKYTDEDYFNSNIYIVPIYIEE